MAIDTTKLPAVNPDDTKAVQASLDRAALAKSFSLQNPLVAAGADMTTLLGRGLGGAYNTAARLPNAFGANLPTIDDNSGFFGGNSASATPYYDKLRTPEQPVAMPVAAPVPVTASAPEPVAPLPAAMAKPAEQSNFDKAIAYSTAGGDMRPEVVGGRFHSAMQGLNGETAANRGAYGTSAEKNKLIQQYLDPNTSQELQDKIAPLVGAEAKSKWTQEKDILGNPTGNSFNTSTRERVDAAGNAIGAGGTAPTPGHIANLKAHPETAPLYDAQFGAGAAKRVLGA